MVYRRWNIHEADENAVKQLEKELNAPALLCKVLVSRGIKTSAEVLSFIGECDNLPDPMEFKDMDKLVQRVVSAVEDGEKIVVFGDYDVDGVTATALMVTYLESIGAEVFYKLPSRTDDGYGLTNNAIKALSEKGVTLIITVDNGVTACEQIEYAKTLGVDVVVTDHHLPCEALPNAAAVVDPLRKDDTSTAKTLSGVGVAYMAVCAIEGCSANEMLEYYSDLVAIGTIADIMVLKDANRTLVKAGIAQLQHTERAGILALLEKCSLSGKPVTSESVSFAISPRLNAAGRMDSATLSLNLLLEEELETAQQLAQQIEEHNNDRQQIEQKITGELIQKVMADTKLMSSPILVVWGKGYHQGVIGIVASRLLERFNKPSIVFSIDENGEAKGSGRSFAGFSLYNAIASCQDILLRFGGHDLAAGLSIDADLLLQFSEKINKWAAINYKGMHRLGYEVDLAVKISEITVEQVEAIDCLAPFGQGNPSPVFVIENALIDAVYPLSDGKHTRLKLSQNQANLYAVIFGTSPSEFAYKQGDMVDVMVSLSVYQGQYKMISGRIKAVRPAKLGNSYLQAFEYYENYCSGAATTKQVMQTLCPVRQDIIDVYRYIGQNDVYKSDLRPVFLALGAEKTGKLMAAIDILKELGHIYEKNIDGAVLLVQNDDKQKKPLTDSCVLAQLESRKV